MNQFTATVTQIEKVESLHQLTFSVGSQNVQMLSLELTRQIEVDNEIKLRIKSTDLGIAKDFSGQVSYGNQLKGIVTSVNNGKLLSSIGLEVEGFTLESVITLKASLEMSLEEGDEVTVLFKGSEIWVC